ncbi:MAG: phosphoribosylanthranilate isomerase [Planctomycetota bacterium]
MKICGLRAPEHARVAVRSGADAVGLVFAPSPRRVTLEEARAVARAGREEAEGLGRAVEAWGVFVDDPPERIRELARGVPLDVVQLHGDETPDFARELARELPAVRLVRAVRVRGGDSLDEVRELLASGLFEAVLLDSYDERARGGTGRTFDWDVARAAALGGRVVLAGGLTPDNVCEAVRRVRPWMVDASSGVESAPGRKDPRLIERFVAEARKAGAFG